MAVLPSVAAADDGTSVVQFKLPSKATIEQLEAQGADLDHGFLDAPGGGVLVSAVVTEAEKAQFEAMGYPAVKTLQTQADVDAPRRSRPRRPPRTPSRAVSPQRASARPSARSALSARTTGKTSPGVTSRSRARPPKRP
jgi:hypothetical protein